MDYKESFKHLLPENLLEYFEFKGIQLIATTEKQPEHYLIKL